MQQTYLFTPGDSKKKVINALNSNADAVIVDLEDGVNSKHKELARNAIYDLLSDEKNFTNRSKKIFVRINSIINPYFDEDIKLLKDIIIDGVVIPKCESSQEIQYIEKLYPKIEIIPLIESVKGIGNLKTDILIGNQVKQIAFGTVDYALDLGVEWTPGGDERKFAMGQLVYISRLLNINPPIDGVFPVINDKEAFINDLEFGKRLGFYGKMIIHPKHIEWIRDISQFTEEQINWSKKVVEAYENSKATGSIALEGKMIDRPVYLKAKNILNSAVDG